MAEFKTLIVNFDKNKHKNSTVEEDFDNQVTDYLNQGWTIVNAQSVQARTYPSFIAYLTK